MAEDNQVVHHVDYFQPNELDVYLEITDNHVEFQLFSGNQGNLQEITEKKNNAIGVSKMIKTTACKI